MSSPPSPESRPPRGLLAGAAPFPGSVRRLDGGSWLNPSIKPHKDTPGKGKNPTRTPLGKETAWMKDVTPQNPAAKHSPAPRPCLCAPGAVGRQRGCHRDPIVPRLSPFAALWQGLAELSHPQGMGENQDPSRASKPGQDLSSGRWDCCFFFFTPPPPVTSTSENNSVVKFPPPNPNPKLPPGFLGSVLAPIASRAGGGGAHGTCWGGVLSPVAISHGAATLLGGSFPL